MRNPFTIFSPLKAGSKDSATSPSNARESRSRRNLGYYGPSSDLGTEGRHAVRVRSHAPVHPFGCHEARRSVCGPLFIGIPRSLPPSLPRRFTPSGISKRVISGQAAHECLAHAGARESPEPKCSGSHLSLFLLSRAARRMRPCARLPGNKTSPKSWHPGIAARDCRRFPHKP